LRLVLPKKKLSITTTKSSAFAFVESPPYGRLSTTTTKSSAFAFVESPPYGRLSRTVQSAVARTFSQVEASRLKITLLTYSLSCGSSGS